MLEDVRGALVLSVSIMEGSSSMAALRLLGVEFAGIRHIRIVNMFKFLRTLFR